MTNKQPNLFSNLSPGERALGVLLAVLGLGGIFLAIFLFPKTEEDKPVQSIELEFGMNVNDSLRLCPDTVLIGGIVPVSAAELCNPSANRSLYGNFRIDPDGCLTFWSFGQVGQDSLCIQVRNERKELFRLLYKITIERRIEEDTADLVISVGIPEPEDEEQKLKKTKVEKGEDTAKAAVKKVKKTAYCGNVKYIQLPLSNKVTRPALEDSRRFAIREVKAIVLYDPPISLAGQEVRKVWGSLNRHSKPFAPHYVIDDRDILQVVPEEEVARHLRGRAFLAPADDIREGELSPNYFSLGVMLASPEGGQFDKLYSNAVRLIACLLDKYGLTTEDLYRHYDMTGKNDPLFLLSDKEWKLFKKAVNKGNKIKG